MKTADADILIVPGWTNSGSDHWQTRWEQKLTSARRVEQDDWDDVQHEAWTERLIEAVKAATKPVVLVAHSLGALLVVHAAPRLPAGKVAGAFLVTPPSEATIARLDPIDDAFIPVPRQPLPFPSVVIASRSDPYATYDEAKAYAEAWGSALSDAGDVGHLNTESGHGPWPEGLMRFAGFIAKL